MTTRDIFLATGNITNSDLFQNGLHQNSLILYDLFETLGYRSICLTDISCEFISGYKHIQPEDYLNQESAFNPVFYIEIGLSLDAAWRAYLQQKGCKTAKLYLGNVLNIDTETVSMTPGLFFHHHILGHFDYVWTSPHYRANCAWLSALHNTPCTIVPYLWTPQFLESLSPLRSSFKSSGDIIVAEPNISFQKTALVPLLLAETYYRENREWSGKVFVQNSERLLVTPFWNQIVESLSLFLDGRIVFSGRNSILKLVQEHPGAIFICHQLTNEYNYMTLELLWLGVPVLHNSESWSDSGHYYSVDKWLDAIQTLKGVLENSSKRNDSKNEALLWSVSPQNPANKDRWTKLLA